MALWTRYPSGVYTRPSTEWWSHRRGRCSIANGFGSVDPLIYGLYNNSSPGVYLHVIGVAIHQEAEGVLPVYGEFITGVPDTSSIITAATISETAPIYSNDPMPPGIGVFGADPNATFAEGLMIPVDLNAVYFYPTNEIAVLAPNDTLGMYYGVGAGQFRIMFEWYWAED